MISALEAELLRTAGSVPDPELPMITLAELGVLRGLHITGPGRVEVELTPTYTGCPAMGTMASDITDRLHAHGMTDVTVRTVLFPPWTTDAISADGRRKLAASGIAPPRPAEQADKAGPADAAQQGPQGRSPGRSGAPGPVPVALSVRCPHCGSPDTTLLSRFSSTACKALRRCEACGEPFDHFKELR